MLTEVVFRWLSQFAEFMVFGLSVIHDSLFPASEHDCYYWNGQTKWSVVAGYMARQYQVAGLV